MNVSRRSARVGLRSLPWLVLGAALVLATMPAWRPLIFGTTLAIEDLVSLRCRPW